MSGTSANQSTGDKTLAAPHTEVLPHMQCMGEIESRPWVFTIIRARGYQPLRPEKSWRPIVSVVVDEHSHYEVNLGCDGQNPNLKERFVIRDADGRSQVNISVYHQAQSKKKHKKRRLVATTSLSLQALSRLEGADSEHSFKIPLSPVAQSAIRGSGRGKVVSAYIIAKLEVPETQARQMHNSSTSEDYLSTDTLGDSSPGSESESESDETTDVPCSSRPITFPVLPESPGILICRGYSSDTDDDRPLDVEHVRLTNAGYENSTFIDNDDDLIYIAPSILPRYTEQIFVDNSLSFIDALVDSFSFYRELREADSDSEYELILEKLKSEWYFVGASLVTLSGLDAAVFGFSSGSLFSVDSFARHSIALGSVASGIGLAIDGWFLLIYVGASSEKFQKHARDIYGKYLFFCISSRLPAVCMFISTCALMAFLIAVAWSAWPKAVLVMCFMAGILVGLQFIIYGLHCMVVCMTRVVGTVGRGFTLCKEAIRQCLRA